MGGSSRKVLFKITSFAIHSSFLLPSFFRREEKRGVEKIHHEKIGPKKSGNCTSHFIGFYATKKCVLTIFAKNTKISLVYKTALYKTMKIGTFLAVIYIFYVINNIILAHIVLFNSM